MKGRKGDGRKVQRKGPWELSWDRHCREVILEEDKVSWDLATADLWCRSVRALSMEWQDAESKDC